MTVTRSSNCDHISLFTKAPFAVKSSEMIGTTYVQINNELKPLKMLRRPSLAQNQQDQENQMQNL